MAWQKLIIDGRNQTLIDMTQAEIDQRMAEISQAQQKEQDREQKKSDQQVALTRLKVAALSDANLADLLLVLGID